MGEYLISFVLGAALIYVILDDLRNARIRNEVVIVLAALFVVAAITRGEYSEAMRHLVFAAVMFLLILAMYALGMMGGGDAKLLAVAFLWLGVGSSATF